MTDSEAAPRLRAVSEAFAGVLDNDILHDNNGHVIVRQLC